MLAEQHIQCRFVMNQHRLKRRDVNSTLGPGPDVTIYICNMMYV